LFTPTERYVLPGVSRQRTLDLAAKLEIPAVQGDLELFDAANADEIFLGAPVGCGRSPGPVTKRLVDAYSAEVGCDFMQQDLDRLG
jgi:branched-chain amino acid aminotransferase